MIDWDQVNSLRKNENMTYLDISTLLGISYGTIRNHYWKNKTARVDRRGYTNWNKHAHLLGVVSDKEIARKLGISIGTIVQKRRREGIGPFGSKKTELEVQRRLVSGLTEFSEFVRLDCGIADVVTSDTIYEVKTKITVSSVQRAIGQLLLYSYSLPNHNMCIVGGSKKINKHVEKRLKEIGIKTIVV